MQGKRGHSGPAPAAGCFVAPEPAAIAGARRRYESGAATLKQLAGEMGLSPRRLGKIRRQEGWAPRGAGRRPAPLAGVDAAAARAALVKRLWAAATRQMDEIEATLASAPGDRAAREQEARLMAMLVRVAAGLAALERAGAATAPDIGLAGAAAPLRGGGAASGATSRKEGGGGALRDDDDAFRRELEGRIDALLRQRAAGDFSR